MKIISNIMTFTMLSQILLSLFQSPQQHSKQIAKKYSPSKKRFFNDKHFISVHFEDEILLGLPYHAFRYHYRRKIKLLWKFFLCSSLQLYGDTDTKYFFHGNKRRAYEHAA